MEYAANTIVCRKLNLALTAPASPSPSPSPWLVRHLALTPLNAQHLECVHPIVPGKSRNAPQHAQWFNCACCFGRTHVLCFPSERSQYRVHFSFCLFAVAADKHAGWPALQFGIHHQGLANAVKGLHEIRLWRRALQPFHEGFVKRGEKLQYTVLRRRVS